MILVTVLTSSDFYKLKRLTKSLDNQTNTDFVYNIVVNTLDKEYEKTVKDYYGDRVFITKSNGTPAFGKNSVVGLWRSKFKDYSFYSLIDGDDLVYPTFVEALYQHIRKHPNTDALGMVCMDVIQPNNQPECWTGNDVDMRAIDNVAPFYRHSYPIVAHDRLILFSKKVLDRLIFNPSLLIYEDYLASLKLLQLYRLGEIEYWLTTSTDMYLYDKTGKSITSSLERKEWTHQAVLLKMKAINTVHYSWSSTKDMLYEIPEPLTTYEERMNFAKQNTLRHIAIYSFGTDPEKCGLLQESARHFEYDLTIEGYGQEYLGHGLKIKNFRKFCENQPPDQVVMFVDAYDVIFVQHAETLYEKWEKLTGGKGVIFNAEVNCHPDVERAPEYPDVENTRFKFLNSGIYMGTAAEMLKILPEDIQDSYDDQRYYVNKFLLDETADVRLDYMTELFMPLCYAVKSVHYNEKGLYNSELGTYPCLLHANFTEFSEKYLRAFFDLVTMESIPVGLPAQEQDELELLKMHNYLNTFTTEEKKYLP